MDYEEQSDFEINKAVAEAVGVPWDGANTQAPADGQIIFCYLGAYGDKALTKWAGWKDYCNNPSDAWPIITENKINLFFDITRGENGWNAKSWKFIPPDDFEDYHHRNTNPLRAAMIVFLKMQEAS